MPDPAPERRRIHVAPWQPVGATWTVPLCSPRTRGVATRHAEAVTCKRCLAAMAAAKKGETA